MGPGTIRPYLAFLVDHRYAMAFVAAVIDSTGLPFPGRLALVAAGAFSASGPDTAWVILLAAAGAVVGDHALYLLGWLGGDKLLSLYCRWTMGSGRCIGKTRDYFRRFGALTILFGRFVAGVRIFAAALAGSGAIRYYQFFIFDALGALVWATAFVLPGYVFGNRAVALLERHGGITFLIVLGLAALASIVAYRVWKRRRHGGATIATAPRGRPAGAGR
jgi:membrane protein DedA with SNARE-associated domain